MEKFDVCDFGRCDILLNNAGIIARGSILDVSTADFDRVLAVNLRGPFLLSRAVATHMVERSIRGTIINMSSTNAVVTIPDQLAYATSGGRAGAGVGFAVSFFSSRESRLHASDRY